jgi:hypothetical protein
MHKETIMHDLDRTQNVFESDYEYDQFEFQDEGESFGGFEGEGGFDEMEESELAAQFLEITEEYELDQFLGNLIKKAGTFLKSPAGQKLKGMLKAAAKKALPIAGAALGNLVAPGIGGKIGSNLASKAGSMFGLELEGLSSQDQEFEVARQFVRFANEAAQQASQIPSTVDPNVAAKTAVIRAAQQFAPGLIQATPDASNGRARRGGSWVRKGDGIFIPNVFGKRTR